MSDTAANELLRTPLHGCHVALAAKLVDFAGWEMPVQYPTGPVAEHLATRKGAGLFDVSHMGRFSVVGPGALAFLRHALTNDAAALAEWSAQYTLIATPTGGAVDDAFVYRKAADEYLLVVNAANRAKDWAHLQGLLAAGEFGEVNLTDVTHEIAMLALQGPASQEMLAARLTDGALPQAKRNAAGQAHLAGATALITRTGYTGEPVCFELFFPAAQAETVWDALVEAGATPVGLAARDTLRLEAALPLYGHELGLDADGKEIPILASPASRLGVDLSTERAFVGRAAIEAQQQALPRRIRPIALTGRGVARQGAAISQGGRPVGVVTSGTMVPVALAEAGKHDFRAIALAYVDGRLVEGDNVSVDVRGKDVSAVVVAGHLGR
ncbi:hypothetical protein LCGC14_0162660 [marine sediment metagenome]|uniref:aminomethyltransferase n=2 Tax=root TaxID=1 RepID=A0A9C9NBP4_9HYPH|nr:glycine cleavage system aminomethyltransferase GcvT [Phycisphaerae bacterium]HET98856.1 glycine cleavage system aminomethyltransferase GcvT [Aurantimonas coralicida]